MFTLICDFRTLSGAPSNRITYVEVRSSRQIGEDTYEYEGLSVYEAVDGLVEIQLPDSAIPNPYFFTVVAPQQDLVWDVPPQPEGSIAYLSQFTANTGSSGGDGSGIVPLAAGNSGVAYEIMAPNHGERRIKLTLTGNASLTLSGGTAGEVCAVQLLLIQDATGSRTVTWPSNIAWGLNGPPVLSSVTGKTEMVYLTTDDGGVSWQGALIGAGYNAPVAPSAPTALAANVVAGDVVLTWVQGAANGATVTHNKIYRGTSPGALSLLATITANTTYTDTTPLTDGTTYYYRVTATNAVGEGAQSGQASAVPGLVVNTQDDFNRANDIATSPSDGLIGDVTPVGARTWINVLASGAWSVSGNKAIVSAANKKAGVDTGVATGCTARGTIAYTGAAADHGLFVKWVDANNFIAVIIDPGGYYIQKTIGGVQTNVANGGGAVGSDQTIALEVVLSGTNVTVFANGVQVVTGVVSDAGVSAGDIHGLMSGGNANVTFDGFQVTVP